MEHKNGITAYHRRKRNRKIASDVLTAYKAQPKWSFRELLCHSDWAVYNGDTENHSGVSKTLRLPENIVDEVQDLANLKNLSFNRVVISLLEFSLNNLDDNDKKEIEKLQK